MKNIKIKSNIIGTKDRPRVSVSKSNKNMFVQLIDDESQKTLVSGSDIKIKVSGKSETESIKGGTKVLRAYQLGMDLARNAKKKKINKAVFDRGKYRYHGRIKAVAEGLRKGGIKV